MGRSPIRWLGATRVARSGLLSGCQTDLPLVELKERYGGPPWRYPTK